MVEEQIARTKGQFLIKKSQVDAAQAYIDKVNHIIDDIGSILLARQENPDLIPVFAEDPGQEESPIFRLSYGPPKAKKGKYLLSVDGLYYDSQERVYADGSPIPTTEDLKFIPAKDRWMMDHSPNLGGRGTSYSIKDLNLYVDTIFDPDKIDNSELLKSYYDADEFLQTLEAQRNTVVSNLNKNLDEVGIAGYNPDSAVYVNYIEQIKSENSAYQRKINKRKKQVEVAVKTPDLFGYDISFSIGNIPVNDFSYLSSINLSVEIEKQKNLVFDHGEISGLVLPVIPAFVHNPGISSQSVLTPLKVSESGIGSYVEGDEIQSQPILSITTGITTNGLTAIYPFTTGQIQSPASLKFTSMNTASYEGGVDNAQLVADKPNLLFQKGIGLPYLTGIVNRSKKSASYEFKGETWTTYPFEIESPGSYAKLPNTDTFNDLLYSGKGATIDVWTYIPGLYEDQNSTSFMSHPFSTSAFDFTLSSDVGKWCDAHYYRVLLGCENTGGENLNLDQSSVVVNRSSTSVRGMLMGFSRDPRMYYNGGPVTPGSTDLNPREYFGTYLSSVDSITTSLANSDSDSGSWILSSLSGAEIGVRDASGTWEASTIGAVSGSLVFTITDAGDGYPLSAHEGSALFQIVSGTGSSWPTNPSGVSSTMNLHNLNINYKPGTASSVFFIAPTQSYNTSSVGFVKNSVCQTDASASILKFTVPTKDIVGSVDFSDIQSKFVNMQVVFDPPQDSLKFYVNGVLFKEDSIVSTFGVSKGSAPQTPSFVYPPTSDLSSFSYNKSTVNQSPTMKLFDYGPSAYPLFTPWIVGGGWTDGRPVSLSTSSGGFLDTGAGLISSYNGYIGSLKFYNRALNITEVKTNYHSQKEFFENIDL